MDLNDGKKVWDGLKSKLGIGAKGQAQGQAYDDGYYDEGYDSYGEYDELGYDQGYGAQGYDQGYDGYDDGYGAEGDYDEYDRYAPQPRGGRSAGGSSLPRLVSMNDARASARRATPYQESRADRFSTPRGFSSGRDMYDSSLPYEMTPEGSAAASARGTRRYEEGFVSPYEAADAARGSSGYADEALSRTSADLGASSASIQERTSASLAALRERIASSGTVRSSASTSAAAPAPAGPRKVTVVKPIRYGEADRIPAALKKGDAVVLVLKGVSGGLDKRILDFSFGAASSLDAEVECIADKVFFIAKGSGLADDERASLQAQGVL